MNHHFERVASVYDDVRHTDPDVIETIADHLLRDNPLIYLADIGCGTGRYSKLIVKALGNDLRLFCFDYSMSMLVRCYEEMSREFPFIDIHYCRGNANHLPFAEGCFDAVTAFNAVHHYDLDRFVAGAARVLQRGGLLSIYTRTPEQNARTMWGQHFPGFTERETRLYEYAHLEETICSAPGLKLEGIQDFEHMRVESTESLLKQARNFHYSTFALYPPDEFGRALERFGKTLNDISSNGTIEHTAENTLVLARRT